MTAKLRVGMTKEMLTNSGELPSHIVGLPLITDPRIDFATFSRVENDITPDLIAGYDAAIAGSANWTSRTFNRDERFCCVARWGVGYDNVDTAACTANDVVLITTRGALDYSVAESALSFMLALSHRMLFKDQLARQNRWKERPNTLGSELREKTIGIVGLGGIGCALVKLLTVFRPAKMLVFDPFLTVEKARELGVEKADLKLLLQQSDIVTIHCPKTPETTNLIGAEQLKWMKPTAYLVNTARGGIVNQKALYEALKSNVIRGAGIDVFEVEPPPADEPLLTLDNVILSPHANSLTDECFRDIGAFISRNLIKLISGENPEFVINKDVLDRPGFRQKLAKLKQRFA